MKYNMRHSWYEKGAYANKKAKKWLNHGFNPTLVKNIAIIRHAALGDQVITRPFIVEARKFFPNAKITLCAVSNYQYGMPDDLVDSVHIMHGSDRKKEITIREKIKNIKELPEQDIIFDLAATNRSYWMMLFAKSKLKIGFPYSTVLGRLIYDVILLRSDLTPEIESMLHMLKFLGHQPEYPLDFAYPNNLLIKNKEKRIVYFNGASQESKRYSQDKLKTLFELALEQFPEYEHVFLEGLSKNEKADGFLHLQKYSNFKVCEALPLGELVEYIAHSTAVVSTDTGVRNLAIATHTPTVGIFFSTVPFRYTPANDRHFVVMNADAVIPEPEEILSCIDSLIIKDVDSE